MTISTERLQEMLAGFDDASPNEEVGGYVGDGSWHSAGTIRELRELITELQELRKGQRAVSEALTDWKPEPAPSPETSHDRSRR